MSKLFMKLVQMIGTKAAMAVTVTAITVTGGTVGFAGYEIASYVSQQQNENLSADAQADKQVAAQTKTGAQTETGVQTEIPSGVEANEQVDAQIGAQADAQNDTESDVQSDENAAARKAAIRARQERLARVAEQQLQQQQTFAFLTAHQQMLQQADTSLATASLPTTSTGNTASVNTSSANASTTTSSSGSSSESTEIVPNSPPIPTPEPTREFINQKSKTFDTYDITEDNAEIQQSYFSDQYDSIFSEKAPTKKYTVMVYLCGTDLETNAESATNTLLGMLKSGYDTSQMNVLVCAGGTNEWKNDYMGSDGEYNNNLSRCAIYYLDPDAIGESESSLDKSAINENTLKRLYQCDSTDMGDPSLFASFINYGTDYFPAENYGTILWNHGGGIIDGVCFSADAEIPDRQKITGTGIIAEELESALASTNLYQRDRKKMAFIGYDACLMSGIEQAYLVSPYCDYAIASSEVSYGDWNYTKLFDFMNEQIEAAVGEGESVDNEVIAKQIAKIYYDTHGGTSTHVATISCFDSAQVQDVSVGIDNVSKAIMELYQTESMQTACFQALKQARIHSFILGSDTNRKNNYDYVDLIDFFNCLDKEFESLGTSYPEYFSQIQNIRTEIDNLMTSYQSAALVQGVKYNDAAIAYWEGSESTLSNENFWESLKNVSIGACSIYMPYYRSSGEMDSYAGMDIMPAYVELLKKYSTDRKADMERVSRLSEVINYADIIEKDKAEKTVSMQQAVLDKDEEKRSYLHLSIKDAYENTTENEKYDDCGTTPFADFMDTVRTVSVYVSRYQKAEVESGSGINIVYGSQDLSFAEISTGEESVNVLKESFENISGYRVEGLELVDRFELVDGQLEENTDKRVYDYATLLAKESYEDKITALTNIGASDTWLAFVGKICWFIDDEKDDEEKVLAGTDANLYFYKQQDESDEEKYVFGGATYTDKINEATTEITLSKEDLTHVGFSAVQFYHYMIEGSELKVVEEDEDVVESNGFKTPTLSMDDLYIYKECLMGIADYNDYIDYNDYTLGFTSVKYTEAGEIEEDYNTIIMDSGQCQGNSDEYKNFALGIGVEISPEDTNTLSAPDKSDTGAAKAMQVETASVNAAETNTGNEANTSITSTNVANINNTANIGTTNTGTANGDASNAAAANTSSVVSANAVNADAMHTGAANINNTANAGVTNTSTTNADVTHTDAANAATTSTSVTNTDSPANIIEITSISGGTAGTAGTTGTADLTDAANTAGTTDSTQGESKSDSDKTPAQIEAIPINTEPNYEEEKPAA